MFEFGYSLGWTVISKEWDSDALNYPHLNSVVNMKKLRVLSLSIAFLLSACGSKIDGTYVGEGMFAASSLTFQSNGKVVINSMGVKAEAPYEKDGDNIKIMAMGGVTFTLKKDGSFDLPGGGTYRKK